MITLCINEKNDDAVNHAIQKLFRVDVYECILISVINKQSSLISEPI